MLPLFLAFAAALSVATVGALAWSEPATPRAAPSVVELVHDWGTRQAWRVRTAAPRPALRLRAALHHGTRAVRRPGRHLAGYVKPLTAEMCARYALPGWRDETGPLPAFADYAPTVVESAAEPAREPLPSVLIDLTPEEIAVIKRAEDI